MRKPKLYRKRYIPDEIVLLKDDIIECIDERHIVTRWKTLKPRNDFCGGRSCYFLNEGYKVSRFMDSAGKCVYTYCDIVSVEYAAAEDAYVFHDLLIDVVAYEDGTVKVLDLREIPEALDRGLITLALAKTALTAADKLLTIIYAGRLSELTAFLEPETE